MTESPDDISQTHLLFALIGAALMLTVGVFVFASTLVAPLWVVVVLGVVWLLAVQWSWRVWRRSMFAPLLAAVGIGVLWIIVIALGDELLGWTA